MEDDRERNEDPVDGEEGAGGRVRPVAVLARHRHVEDGHHVQPPTGAASTSTSTTRPT